MANLEKRIAGLGGLASMRELMAFGYRSDFVRVLADYGRIVKVRKGWYALRGTEALVLQAWQAGGRLACVSALAFYDLCRAPSGLHVAVKANASRLRTNGAVIHWSRRDLGGDGRIVSLGAAVRQASGCPHVSRDSL
jgi:hypothetical protein